MKDINWARVEQAKKDVADYDEASEMEIVTSILAHEDGDEAYAREALLEAAENIEWMITGLMKVHRILEEELELT